MTQHIKFSTHKANHIIDHIDTELFNNIKVTNYEQKDLVSDHHIIVFNTSITKCKLTTTTISNRKLKEVNPVDIAQKVSLNAVYPDLDSWVEAFNDQLMTALDKLAPLKIKRLNTQQTVPCFTDHIIDLKRSMQRKKIWKKYRRDDHLKLVIWYNTLWNAWHYGNHFTLGISFILVLANLLCLSNFWGGTTSSHLNSLGAYSGVASHGTLNLLSHSPSWPASASYWKS